MPMGILPFSVAVPDNIAVVPIGFGNVRRPGAPVAKGGAPPLPQEKKKEHRTLLGALFIIEGRSVRGGGVKPHPSNTPPPFYYWSLSSSARLM